MTKGKVSVLDPHLSLMDPDPGGPKTCGVAKCREQEYWTRNPWITGKRCCHYWQGTSYSLNNNPVKIFVAAVTILLIITKAGIFLSDYARSGKGN
jgi:hypothetical protein